MNHDRTTKSSLSGAVVASSYSPVIPLSRRPVVQLAIALAILWLPVIYMTGAQWTIFEQYHYGWAVPFMCLFFAWERAKGREQGARSWEGGTKQKAESKKQKTEPENLSAQHGAGAPNSNSVSAEPPGFAPGPVVPSSRAPVVRGALLLTLCALIFGASRFLLEANPTWRAPAWGLVVAAAGMTLTLIYVAGGQSWLRRFLFPVAFFFIAVPWPTPLENLVTQNLMRLNVAIVIELLNVFSIPALAHGNVIELSRGVVGVEEACSGIRSLQASLMIALFFGEFFRLRVLRRIGLVFGGIVFAMFFNVCRTYFLAWICARYGNTAVDTWHDRAGFFVLLCFIATWLLGVWLQKKQKAESRKQKCADSTGDQKSEAEGREPQGAIRSAQISAFENVPSSSPRGPVVQLSSCPVVRSSPASLFVLCSLLICFVVVTELSTKVWYRAHEQHDIKPAEWTAHWPEAASDFKTRTIPHATQAMLQCSRDSLASWQDADGHQWQGIYLRWDSSNHFYGRARASLAKGHRPDACLPAIGLTLESELPPGETKAGDLTFHFRRYLFRTLDGQPIYVFFMVADDRLQALSTSALSLERSDRFQLALAGKRSGGQRSLEVAVTGFDSPDTAWSAFQQQLPSWISPR